MTLTGRFLTSASSIGGVDFDPADPAYRRVLVRPIHGKGITCASANLQTLRGRIVTSWQIHDSTFNLVVHLPPNMTGMVSVPDGTEHRFMPTNTNLGAILIRKENSE